ncbi:MAG: hypothetical protein GY851_24725, partial [bacterium]|nr:hypothetical protein [bacterium]
AAFIVCNGDIVRRGRMEEYLVHHLRLIDLLAPTPFITVPGNHEAGPFGDFAPYKAIYGTDRFSFDYGGCRIVGVNNGDSGMSRGDLRYLRNELAKPGADHKFVVFHVPPLFVQTTEDEEEGRGFRWNSGKLRVLMTEMNVDQVFMGHIHGFNTQVVDGVRYTITGGAGASLSSALPKEGQVHNYVVVHVT